LIIKEGYGHYFYELLRADDCKRIIDGDYQDISADLKYYKGDFVPFVDLFLR